MVMLSVAITTGGSFAKTPINAPLDNMDVVLEAADAMEAAWAAVCFEPSAAAKVDEADEADEADDAPTEVPMIPKTVDKSDGGKGAVAVATAADDADTANWAALACVAASTCLGSPAVMADTWRSGGRAVGRSHWHTLHTHTHTGISICGMFGSKHENETHIYGV